MFALGEEPIWNPHGPSSDQARSARPRRRTIPLSITRSAHDAVAVADDADDDAETDDAVAHGEGNGCRVKG